MTEIGEGAQPELNREQLLWQQAQRLKLRVGENMDGRGGYKVDRPSQSFFGRILRRREIIFEEFAPSSADAISRALEIISTRDKNHG